MPPDSAGRSRPSEREADDWDRLLLQLCRLTAHNFLEATDAAAVPMTTAQVQALTVISSASSGIGLSALGELLGMSAPSVSRLCQRLERDGLLIRRSGVGRAVEVTLSGRGRRVLSDVDTYRVDGLRQMVESLDPDAQQALRQGLAALTARHGVPSAGLAG